MSSVYGVLRFAALHRSYRQHPDAFLQTVGELLARYPATPDPAWILRLPDTAVLARAEALLAHYREWRDDPSRWPLYGLPFAVKDNIDVAGLPTTAACPEFAYVPTETAPAVQRLLDAGAILLGKTNLDQFATGLVGVRSPYGICPNPFDPAYICGGSSAGSASVVARGLVSFALGTDTAGSGRVPAAFTHTVGLKPTCGWVSSRGVVPACRSLDCVSVFAADCEDACRVTEIMAAFDPADPYSRPAGPVRLLPKEGLRIGMPAELDFCGDPRQQQATDRALAQLDRLGMRRVTVDFAPFREAAALLYHGPWVAERLLAVEPFLQSHPRAVHPTVRTVLEQGRSYLALDVFRAAHRLQALKRQVDGLWAEIDALLVPTTPTIYTIEEVLAEPLARNYALGQYTNFVNLLDLAALAVPAGFRTDALPFGMTLIGPAWSDRSLAEWGACLQRHWAGTGEIAGMPPAAEGADAPETPGTVRVAVVGAHLAGQPLNGQLTERGARLLRQTRTAPCYRLYALPGATPPKPGLIRVESDGTCIGLEVWEMPVAAYGEFVSLIPAPLGIGRIELENGETVQGFLCEGWALTGARDISEFGGWLGYFRSIS